MSPSSSEVCIFRDAVGIEEPPSRWRLPVEKRGAPDEDGMGEAYTFDGSSGTSWKRDASRSCCICCICCSWRAIERVYGAANVGALYGEKLDSG